MAEQVSAGKKLEMKKRYHIYYWIMLAVAVVYLLLVALMYLAEVGAEGARIQSLGDVIWFSLVTLTTVGYGDKTPVTPMGHVVGAVFLILSAGLLVTLFGTMVSFLTGEAFPLFRLGFQKKKNWYYFADFGTEANTLAKNILKEDPEAVIIFGEKRSERSENTDYPCYFLQSPPQEIFAKKGGQGAKCKVFFMKENDIGVNRRAIDIYSQPVEVYARTSNGQDSLSGNIHFFHSYECCARQYWRSKSLKRGEESIVLIGFGQYGQNLLEKAILTNVIAVDQKVNYHIFGDSSKFRKLHPRLSEVFEIQISREHDWKEPDCKQSDALIFHEDDWEGEHRLLEYADRVIICEDDEQEGWRIYWQLQKFYAIRGRIDLRNSRKAPGVSYFGTDDDIYNPRQILRTQLDEAAIIMNELFRKSTNMPTLCWEELDDFLRQSKIAAADHLIVKVRMLLGDEEIKELTSENTAKAYKVYCEKRKSAVMLEQYRKLEHLRWLRFYAYLNWTEGKSDDGRLRTHPTFRPYEELNDRQKRGKDHAWELIDSISGEIK